MSSPVSNPDFLISGICVTQSDRTPGQHDILSDSVCKARVSQNFFNDPLKEAEPVFSEKETVSRKRKEREVSSEFSLENSSAPQRIEEVKRLHLPEPYIPFYTIDPMTKAPKPPISLEPFIPKESKYLKIFPQPSQSSLPDQEMLEELSGNEQPILCPKLSDISPDSWVKSQDKPKAPVQSASSSSFAPLINVSSPSASSSSAKEESSYSLRRIRTPNCRLRPLEDLKPSTHTKNGMIELFEDQGIEYIADVRIEPKYESAIASIFHSIPDDDLSDDTDPEGKACTLCIQTMKDDASDKYASAIEVREVVFTLEDGTKVVEKGVFAKRPINEGAVIGIYAGDLVPLDACKDRDKDYIFEFSEPAFEDWGIDGKKRGNFTRYLNHCTEENENITATGFYDGKIPRIILIATKPIAKGEELKYCYGDAYWERKGIKPSNS